MKTTFYPIFLFLFPIICLASQPVSQITTFHEQKKISPIIKNETSTQIVFFDSAKKNANQIGTLELSFSAKRKKKGKTWYAAKTGFIDLLEIYKGFQKKGYGTSLFKRAIIELVTLGAKSIRWEAQPLERFLNRNDLSDLERFYQRYGGIILKSHKNNHNNYVEMAYPMALAHALTVLHPIFVRQEKSLLLAHTKQEDPFALIVAYANIDLENNDLKAAS